ncbi:MAG: InlB B-repeat-containing protein [Firmicutes bacterium]|nr:InlB B-repeat-containing protein [Bacillota bacterium]
MKRKQWRLLSLLLIFAMILSMMPATALALEAGGESGTIPEAVTVTLEPLPDGLQQVEYIESTKGGAQDIKLGFMPKDFPNMLRSEIDLQYSELPDKGGTKDAGAGCYSRGFYYLAYGVNRYGQFIMHSGGNGKEIRLGNADNERHIFILDQATGTCTIDYNRAGYFNSDNSKLDAYVSLFMTTGSDSPCGVKIYSARYYNGSELIRDMVPCYAKSGVNISGSEISAGTIGMYDRIEGKFYANSTSGADFKKGNDVNGITDTLTVTLNEPTMLYTGEELTPSVTVKHGENTLNKGTDYTLTYTNNINIGTGVVTVELGDNYGKERIRLPFSIIAPTDIYYQEGEETQCIYSYCKDSKLYMFLPATANYENLKLYLPENAELKYGDNTIIVTNANNGTLNMTTLFGNDMESGVEYTMTVSIADREHNVALIKSANIPALYITTEKLENSSTGHTVTEGDSYTWLDNYINNNKEWKAISGDVVMVNADGTEIKTGLKSLKGRGNSSWSNGGKKKPYNIKLADEKELVSGAGASKNWCLISNYMGTVDQNLQDGTGLVNSIAFWLFDEIDGDSPVKFQPVDLYINGAYRGNYTVVEKVEIDEARVNVTKTKYGTEEGVSTMVTDGSDPAIAAGIKEYYYSAGTTLESSTSGGGYLLESNLYYDEVCKFTTKQGVKFTLKEPEYATKEQVQQIALYVQEFENALFSDTGYNELGKHYSEYVDIDSLAKKLMVDSFMGNSDIMVSSAYFHIDANTFDEGGSLKVNFNGKMSSGPAWDYNFWSAIKTGVLWKKDAKNGQVWLNKFLEKGDLMDSMYQLNEDSFKSLANKGAATLASQKATIDASKTMEDILMGNDFAGKSTTVINTYNNRLNTLWPNIWANSKLMGVSVETTDEGLKAKVNGTAVSYQWYSLNENHEATEILGATSDTYSPAEYGVEYQVKATGSPLAQGTSNPISMFSSPFTYVNPDIAKVENAFNVINGDIYSDVTQATANDITTLNAYVKGIAEAALNTAGISDVTVTVTDGAFTAAKAGDAENVNGTNGSYSFTITVSKGAQTKTTGSKSLTITTTAYTGVSNVEAVAAAMAAIGDGSVDVAFGANQDAKTDAVKNYVNSKLTGDAAGVNAVVTYNAETGKYKVVLSKGTASDSKEITMKIIEAAQTYTVTFAKGEGTGSMDAQTATHGVAFTLPECTFTAPEGKQFKGWATSATGEVITGTTYEVTEDVTFYAIWETIPVTTYTVSFNANGGTVTESSSVTGADGKLSILPTPTRSGYTFNGWYTLESGGTKVTIDTVFKADTTIYAQWTANSPSGGGGGIYIPPTEKPATDPTQSGNTTTTDMSGSTVSKGGQTTTTVDKQVADKLVETAVKNNSEEIVINAATKNQSAASSTKASEVTVPVDTLQTIAEKTNANITIKTNVAEVKLDNKAAEAVASQAQTGTVTIVAEKVKEDAKEVYFELKVVSSSGEVISDFNGGNVAVTVNVPNSLKGKKMVCVYIDENGYWHKVPGQLNANGTYTFTTEHFSTYAIMSEEEADAVIAEQQAAKTEQIIKGVEATTLKATSSKTAKGIKITWTKSKGYKVDYFEVYRSTKKNSGYGKKPFYTTKSSTKCYYINTKDLKKGTKYYYKVRGVRVIDGQKYYTEYSTKAIRTW